MIAREQFIYHLVTDEAELQVLGPPFDRAESKLKIENSARSKARPGPTARERGAALPEVAFGIWTRPSQHSASVIAGVSK